MSEIIEAEETEETGERDHNDELIQAVQFGDAELIRLCVENGADVNVDLGEGSTLLHEIVDYAIDDMLQSDRDQPSPQSLKVIRALVECGGMVDKANDEGETPLHIIKAYAGGDQRTMEKLKDCFRNIIPEVDDLVMDEPPVERRLSLKQRMHDKTIKGIIDIHLKRLEDAGLNKLPAAIEAEMADPDQDRNEECQIWHPIPSKVTDPELEELEQEVGHKLPGDYKTFLRHKHFYELQISEVSFFSHPVNTWRAKQIDNIFHGYPREYLIDRGLLPFANWSDWGMLCFDTNRNTDDHNYPVVLWDHEAPEEVLDQYKDFYDLLVQADLQEKETSANEEG